MQPDTPVPDTGSSEDTVISAPAIAAKCAKCHGKQGAGVKRNPALAGMKSAVFIEQMNLYLTGERENRIMNKLARSLSEDELAELAVYYERLPVIPTVNQVE